MRIILFCYIFLFSLQLGAQKNNNINLATGHYFGRLNLGTSHYFGSNALGRASTIGLNVGTDFHLLTLNKVVFNIATEIQFLPLNDKSYFGNAKSVNAYNVSICTSFNHIPLKKLKFEPYFGLGFQHIKHQIVERAFLFTLGSLMRFASNSNTSFFIKLYYQNNNYNYPYINSVDENLFKHSQSFNLSFGVFI